MARVRLAKDEVFERYLVPFGRKKFRLADFDPRGKTCFPDRAAAEARTREDISRIDELQDVLYAQGKHALLVVLQAMDAGGKDGTIRKVFGPVDPLGLAATNFKKPSERELSQDYLWRVHKAVPPRGMIGIFNRSHYEDVLIVRVLGLAPDDEIERRYGQIKDFEKHMAENRVTILKFYLHISKDEQKKRLQARLDEPNKRWKFNPADLKSRALWDEYMAAYEEALHRCSTPWAPWFVVPADRKWHRNAVIAHIVRQTMEGLDLGYPPEPPGLGDVVIDG
jgi:PPK2 family polyphosphate:nucleotide phosphotransferase